MPGLREVNVPTAEGTGALRARQRPARFAAALPGLLVVTLCVWSLLSENASLHRLNRGDSVAVWILLGASLAATALMTHELRVLLSAAAIGLVSAVALVGSIGPGFSKEIVTSFSEDTNYAIVVNSEFHFVDDPTYSVTVYRMGDAVDHVIARFCQPEIAGAPSVRWVGGRTAVLTFLGRPQPDVTLRISRSSVDTVEGTWDPC